MAQPSTIPELNVGRINIVESDGTLRMVISNRDLFPTEMKIGNRVIKRENRGPGILFFNDDGVECGGLCWSGSSKGGHKRGNMSLTFDQVDQDQVVGLHYSEDEHGRSYGFDIWDRPDRSLDVDIDEALAVHSMPEGPEKWAALRRLLADCPRRIFMGKDSKGNAVVELSDSRGRTRIRLMIDKSDTPRIELLDQNGAVVWATPIPAP